MRPQRSARSSTRAVEAAAAPAAAPRSARAPAAVAELPSLPLDPEGPLYPPALPAAADARAELARMPEWAAIQLAFGALGGTLRLPPFRLSELEVRLHARARASRSVLVRAPVLTHPAPPPPPRLGCSRPAARTS